MFANYEFYQQEYHGTAIGSASSYSYYGGLAAEYIEQATFGRAISANENNLKKIKKFRLILMLKMREFYIY